MSAHNHFENLRIFAVKHVVGILAYVWFTTDVQSDVPSRGCRTEVTSCTQPWPQQL